MKSVALTLVLLLGTACATYQSGRLAAASTTLVPIEMTTIREKAQGSSCGKLDQRLERAIGDVLQKSPGANALVDVSVFFERFCLVVRGTAVRVPQRADPAGPGGAQVM